MGMLIKDMKRLLPDRFHLHLRSAQFFDFSLYERLTGRTLCLDLSNRDMAYRLTELHPDRSITQSLDTVKIRFFNGTTILVKAACTESQCADGCLCTEFFDRTKINKADSARTVAHNFHPKRK